MIFPTCLTWLERYLCGVMKSRPAARAKPATTEPPSLWELPPLCSAAQVAAALQVSSKTALNWSKGPTPRIPVAFSAGKIIRFDPRQVARALGIPAPAGMAPVGSNGEGQSATNAP